ncbi:MAG: YdbH domain-containing protein [Desulfosarcina sp.]|nr:YdbH domain-containing protein [Desulfosarcina sp.]
MAGVRIHTGAPRFSLTANGDRQGGTAHWQLNLNTIQASGAGAFVNLPSAYGKGQLQFKYEPNGPVWVGDARIQIPTLALDGNGMAGKLNTLTLSTRFQQQRGDAPAVDAQMRFSNGQFHHKNSGLHLSGGRLDIPFRSDPKATGSDGTFSVVRVVHNQQSLGKIQGRVTQKKDALAFTATHVSDLFPGLTAALTGTVFTSGFRFRDADITFQIPPYELPAASDLARFVPAAKGLTLSGTVSAQGKAAISRKGLDGFLDVEMTGGALTMAEKKITVEGIDTTLRFPELPRIRSGPAQQIRFARAAMGGIVVDGGTFDVQVESETTLFVEKGRLFWCGGKVDAQALRITAGKQDYNVSLYCQRLGLSRILEQLGSMNARGTGTVNGRIPIVYSNGNIRFDDGFLFSTPGEAGRIQLTGTEILTRGIPAGTAQFAQVELAQEALKDYAYTWAKLGLVSEGEDFVMRLQFDGKPANPLPFVYKKEIGSFVRVEAGAQGSVFQGIGLDVNLRLPLNQLLQYKDIVNMIQ